MSQTTLRSHSFGEALFKAAYRHGGTIHADRIDVLAVDLKTLEPHFSDSYPSVEGKKNRYEAVLDYEWGDKIGDAIRAVGRVALRRGWLTAGRIQALPDHSDFMDVFQAVPVGVDAGGMDAKSAQVGSSGTRSVPFSSTMDSKAFADLLLSLGICRAEGHRVVARSGLTIPDWGDLDRGEWVEIFPKELLGTRKSVQRFLRSQGCILAVDPVLPTRVEVPSVPAPDPAAIKSNIREALKAGDFVLARRLGAQLRSGGDGSDSRLSQQALARPRATTNLRIWTERRQKAIANCDIDSCERLAGYIKAAEAVSKGGVSDQDFRRYLEIEEKVRKDAEAAAEGTDGASAGMEPRLRSVMDRLKGFIGDDEVEAEEPLSKAVAGSSSFQALPNLRVGDTAASGHSNVMSLYALDDADAKVEPAFELRKLAKTHARMHPHVLLPVPQTRDGAERWISLCEQKYRDGNAALSASARMALSPPVREVHELFYASREMISKSASTVERESDAAVIFGYLALIACHCALGGQAHFDHYFDRNRNQGMASVTVLNLAKGFAREYSRYKDYQRAINHETQMSKAKYASIHRKLMANDEADLDTPSTSGSGGRARLQAWTPSAAALKLTKHPADKVGPSMEILRCLRGWYEAQGAIKPEDPGCKHCGLPHDPAQSVCHMAKFPFHRSKKFREAFKLAQAAGYIKCSDVDEWNSRPGREDADRCDKSGRHMQYKAVKHLRKGVKGGPSV